ncbi:murein L,D-transpeptidase [Rhizobium sp. TRM95111]|uniref:L,D-transpeptidase family protein n=1 Tax=Rhizobium alarense TaxID=2846851 RepID=UPI001F37A7A2|nr:murein L,D-transpeptidase [Rhizobium alarense]MCF3642776.1 murein L,D-transpeptidase [Rhizobium alarense]
MTFLKNAALTALMLSCTVAAVDVTPANAQSITLMDMLRGKRSREQRTDNGLPGVFPGQSVQTPAMQAESRPLPKVTGPRYYTYKADGLKTLAMTELSDPVVTGSIGARGLAPLAGNGNDDVRRAFPGLTIRAVGESAKAVQDFYARNDGLIWVANGFPNARAKAALAVLADAASVGLDPEDYAVDVPPDSFDRGDMLARDRALAKFEVKLSAAVATYVLDTVRGRIDPNRISGYHDFARKTVNLSGALGVIARSGDVAAYLRSRSPSGAHFKALVAELKALKASGDTSERVSIADGTLLKPGQSNPELANIVKGVVKQGSDALKTDHSVTIATYAGTPDYTPELVSLVEAFQQEKGLKPDGVIGAATIRKLVGGDSVSDRIAKVEAALEQARWLPADLGGRYVFINQPAFMAYYHENGAEQFAMRTVVGSKANQTYFFEDEIQTVEFNPYWGVPQSIIINEMLPKLRSDPSYLDRMGYEVAVGGRAVPSSSVNWHGSTSGVSVRQPPSGDNALGELKILFPNSHAIYMHDTPSKSFFKRDMRALSHGCVRLSEPRKMAAAVLGTTVEHIGAEIAQGGNKAVSVPERIPVYVSYFTAWPNKDGKVEYFDDVYGRDDYLRKAVEATRAARHAQG